MEIMKRWKQVGAAGLCAVFAFGVLTCARLNTGGEIFTVAANRSYDPYATEIFMDENMSPLADKVDANSTEAIKAEIRVALDETNREREEAGLDALVWDASLAQCAAVRATEATQNWSHTRPNGSAWWTVNSQVQYGENLAKNYQSGTDVVEGWMASPTHKANILTADYKTIGIAVYNYNGKWYWSQEFGY